MLAGIGRVVHLPLRLPSSDPKARRQNAVRLVPFRHCPSGLPCSLGCLALLLIAIGCSGPPAAAPDVARPVKTLVVSAGDDTRIRSFPGTLEASKRVELAFQVAGLLVKFPVKEGEKIAKGELIGELRQDEFRARLTALQGQLDQSRAALAALRAGERPEEQLRRDSQMRAAEARLANARADLNRASGLVQGRTITRQEFDSVETSYRVAQEDLKAAVQLREKGLIGREEDIQAREAEVRGLEGRVV
jgi:membrane fusion protein, multidrug efflux system